MAELSEKINAPKTEAPTENLFANEVLTRPQTQPPAPDAPVPQQDSASKHLNNIDTSGWEDSSSATKGPEAPKPGANPWLTPAYIESADQTAGGGGGGGGGGSDSTHFLDKMNSHVEEDNNAPELGPASQDILDGAKDGVGKQLWNDSDENRRITRDGKLGAAVSVSKVLQGAGYDINEPLIRNLEKAVKEAGFMEHSLEERRPGDVLVYNKPDGSFRTGIIGENGKVLGMLPDGTWGSYDMPKNMVKGRVLRAPDTCLE